MEEMTSTAKAIAQEQGKLEGLSEQDKERLYDMIGLGALKYFMLKVDPKRSMLFDPVESVDFQGNTGPFIQYVHARICAILRKSEQLGIEPKVSENLKSLEPTEGNVLQLIIDFPAKIDEAAREYAPSIIANYVYEVAKAYNKFYSEVSIFNESDQEALAFRIGFSKIVAETIQKSMNLLGAEVPTKM
jgi:arginyl-tRNA synthetase